MLKCNKSSKNAVKLRSPSDNEPVFRECGVQERGSQLPSVMNWCLLGPTSSLVF